MGVDPEEQVAILQARIHERLAELRAVARGVPGQAAGRESLDPDSDLEAGSEVREIDLTDGIDLRDARPGWDEDGDVLDLDDSDEPERDELDDDQNEDDWGGDQIDRTERADRIDRNDRAGRSAWGERAEWGETDEPGPKLLGDLSLSTDLDEPRHPARRERPSLQEATDAVIAATRELINYERRLPMLMDAQPRRLSLLIVRWSGVLTAAVAGSVLLAALAGWLPRWWALPALICGGAAYLLLRLPVHPPGDRHESLRPGSVVVAFGALVTAICAASGLPATVLLLGVVAIGAGIWHVQQTPLRIAALPRRVRDSWH
ncbi:hypothetical protein LWF15_15770 [Kineosporia rhizophila]|uniref:sulfite exporter TauE/SafE family protein n=1 Tax=Kineosporia TaxID=49184 RepID=UPI001E28FC1A|nr:MULTISPECIES: sulfite exporter TauE/SafE family protein [Kineosporia]MCE0536961.1 hypothetical protein [Kineosporia rhizophila]GLY19117.1 hypothetical protein Kisp01_61310 [Kineosporia sp. NBRC 101677]